MKDGLGRENIRRRISIQEGIKGRKPKKDYKGLGEGWIRRREDFIKRISIQVGIREVNLRRSIRIEEGFKKQHVTRQLL